MSIQINDLIPVTQKQNQSFSNINDILQPHNLYSKDLQLQQQFDNLKQDPENYRIDVVKGVHVPPGDSWHFNINIYYYNEILVENLHVYVLPVITNDEFGNPILYWVFDPSEMIT